MQPLWQDLRCGACLLFKPHGFILIPILTMALSTGFAQIKMRTIPLDVLNEVKLRNAKTEIVTYKNRRALRVTDIAPSVGDGDRLVILSKSEFGDGVIEIDLTGAPGASAVEGARRFVGVAFRLGSDASKFECFYLRPTNGRADDQMRRNHSVQYISFPDFPWQRLRKEFPEKYGVPSGAGLAIVINKSIPTAEGTLLCGEWQ